MLGSINNRGKVSEPCLSSPIITLHRGTLSIPPAPKGERPNGSFTQWSVTVHQNQVITVVSLLLLSFWAAKVFFRTYVFVNETLSPLKTINGLMNQLYSFGPLAMISLCTSSANPLYMALSDLYWVYSKHFRLSKIIISFLGFMQVRIYPKTRIADCDRLKKQQNSQGIVLQIALHLLLFVG